ncbi:MAG: family 65 glycosyl hydrolase [Candidatus Reconcilbacillus cellulovorans]|uniref:Family 65 glycosyl hydrolase n=1 Tax=Candidatus Reconcilbacillus cellulovorans TaxID=1906605 RepID=A0A2A6E2F6_9BACL|nr:MAG: family 65 glycosyl hydrolase [Candidatus Reconcilbacillus cellulovorans]
MNKTAEKYLEVHSWKIVENGFHAGRALVSESLFSLANEFMGVRGYFEEGTSGPSRIGSFFNGVFEEEEPVYLVRYPGISYTDRFMVNAVDWLHTRIRLDGETLDCANGRISGFRRELDFRSGVLTRELVWTTAGGKRLKIVFRRLLGMKRPNRAAQRIALEPLNFSGTIELEFGLDFSVLHYTRGRNYWSCGEPLFTERAAALAGRTRRSGKNVFSAFRLVAPDAEDVRRVSRDRYAGIRVRLPLASGRQTTCDREVFHRVEKNPDVSLEAAAARGMEAFAAEPVVSFDELERENREFWDDVWNRYDVEIDGDADNQQGIRYCIFQLIQTYRGLDPAHNIGAKGLTGEVYGGHAFWETETYCLPFYLLTNPEAARSLLMFRYRTLPEAKRKAASVGCRGAFYPVATIDGTESCGLWQHANLQLQVSSGVAYAIRHYAGVTGDVEFLHREGMEMLIEICRFFASRGQWGQRSGKFGFYGVMGPDEFKMMVNHNYYLNFTAKKCLEYTLATAEEMRRSFPEAWNDLVRRTGLNDAELADWANMAANMRLARGDDGLLLEQHEGFFDLPHLDVRSIPRDEFPLYHHWPYDKIFRYDMIKQPDVLMLMFLYSHCFSEEEKRANYAYYEPRCAHESSLSPAIHSILAAELGDEERACRYFEFATRLDLDDYNRNADQGLHLTSMAAAWLNIVYGFGGMRSDGELLSFRPMLPGRWNGYRFRIVYRGVPLEVAVTKREVTLRALEPGRVDVSLYDRRYEVTEQGVVVPLRTSAAVSSPSASGLTAAEVTANARRLDGC